MPSNVILQEHTLLPSTIDGAIWRYSRPDHKPAHYHGQLEFLLVLRGHAVERIGQTEVTVHAGQLVWHLPGVAHEMVAVSADLDLRVVQLEPDLALAGPPAATTSSFLRRARNTPSRGGWGHWARWQQGAPSSS